MPKPKKITQAVVNFLSLCPRGKNGFRTLYKADDNDPTNGDIAFSPMLKATPDFDERGQLVAAVYVPGVVDADGHWTDLAGCEMLAHSFAKGGMKLDLVHDEKPLTPEQVFVAESFVIQKGDPRFEGLKTDDGKAVDPAGGWGAVLQVQDPALRKAYREGGWGGVSFGGRGKVEEAEPPASILAKMTRHGDQDMTPEEFKKAQEENNKALAKMLGETIGAVMVTSLEAVGFKKAEEKKVETPTIDLNDPEALRKAADEAEAKKLDLNDPEALRKHAEKIEKAKKAADGDGKNDSEEVKRLKLEKAKADEALRKALGQSNQASTGAEFDSSLFKSEDLAKTMTDYANA